MIEVLANIHETLVENIHKYRKLRGLTLPTLAERADIQESTLKGIVYNENWPERANIEAISSALEIPTGALFEPSEVTPVRIMPSPLDALKIIEKALKEQETLPVALAARIRAVITDKDKLHTLEDFLLDLERQPPSNSSNQDKERGKRSR